MERFTVIDPTDVVGRRVGAALLDWGLIGLVAIVVVAVASLRVPWAVAAVLGALAAVGWLGLTHVWLQGTHGYTPGKAITGVRAVDADGRPCGSRRALVRTASWVVDDFPYVLPGLAGLTGAVSDPTGQRWGDRRAGTWVVDRSFVGWPPASIALPLDPRTTGHGSLLLIGSGEARLPDGTTSALTAPIPTAPDLVPRPPAALAPASGIHERSMVRPERGRRRVTSRVSLGVRGRLADARSLTEPHWDSRRGAYVRWNPFHRQWLVFDERQHTWTPT